MNMDIFAWVKNFIQGFDYNLYWKMYDSVYYASNPGKTAFIKKAVCFLAVKIMEAKNMASIGLHFRGGVHGGKDILYCLMD